MLFNSIILGLYQFKGENGTSVHFTANQVEIVWVSGSNTLTIDFFGTYLLKNNEIIQYFFSNIKYFFSGEYYEPSVSFPYVSDPTLTQNNIGTFLFQSKYYYQCNT